MGNDNYNENIPNRCNWGNGSFLPLPEGELKKEEIIRNYMSLMIRRVSEMFEWKNLPDTIPQYELERQLQMNGFTAFVNVETTSNEKAKTGYYAIYGALGGINNAYYRPTLVTINNPWLRYNKVLEIDKECVLVKNDMNYEGLYSMYYKYATLLAEADITFDVLSIQARVPFILYAENSDMKMTLNDYIKSIKKGEISYILGNRIKVMQDGLPSQIDTKQYSSTSSAELIKSMIELRQYVRAQWYTELGIQDSFNMKREALSKEEINLADDTLMPLIDEMLSMRQEACKKINDMYGLELSVDFSSVWKERREENELRKELQEAEVEAVERRKRGEGK